MKHTTNRALKSYALQYMQTQTNSLEYTKHVISLLHQQAETALGRIQGQNYFLATIMARMGLD